MESRAYALVTGLFVLGVAGCIAIWAQWLAKTPLARTPYRVVATVPVSGLNPEAQVRYRGISVGRVKSIRLDAKDARRILVDIDVDEGIPITKGTYAQLGMEGITGIAYVHLQDDYKNMEPAAKADSGLVEVPLKPAWLDVLADSAEGAVKDARELMASLNELMTPENRRRMTATLASLERMSTNLEVTAARLPAWLSEENRRLATGSLQGLNDSAKNLPELTREAQQLVKDARELAVQVGKLTNEAAAAANSVREDTLPRVNALAEQVERDSQRVGRLALQLDRDPQSLLFGKQPTVRPGPGEPGFK